MFRLPRQRGADALLGDLASYDADYLFRRQDRRVWRKVSVTPTSSFRGLIGYFLEEAYNKKRLYLGPWLYAASRVPLRRFS
jgi:hypothetical protein